MKLEDLSENSRDMAILMTDYISNRTDFVRLKHDYLITQLIPR